MKLASDRLYLRPLLLEDKNALFSYRKDKITNKYQGWIPETLEDAEAFINRTGKNINEPETWFQLVVVEKSTDTIVGDIGLHFIGEENQQVEIGCTFRKETHRQGYATEAVNRVVEYLFADLNKHRVLANILAENLNAIALVERVGFEKEAHHKEGLFADGKWVDHVVFAMLRKDWTKK